MKPDRRRLLQAGAASVFLPPWRQAVAGQRSSRLWHDGSEWLPALPAGARVQSRDPLLLLALLPLPASGPAGSLRCAMPPLPGEGEALARRWLATQYAAATVVAFRSAALLRPALQGGRVDLVLALASQLPRRDDLAVVPMAAAGPSLGTITSPS